MSNTKHTTTNRNKVLLHFGADKSGSTAIQNMLYENRQILAKLGIIYSDSRLLYNSVQSGNGDKLYLLLKTGATGSEITKILSSLVETGKLSIISCEGFSNLSNIQLKPLYECLNRLKIDFKVLVYVRNPVDYYMSSYNQAVKRHGYHRDFNEFISESTWTHASTLMKLRESTPSLDVTVVSYDQNKSHLYKSFWESIHAMYGIDATSKIPESAELANRSLYMEEINFMVMINKLFGGKFSTLISDFILNETRFIGTTMKMSQKNVTEISMRHKDDVEWINQNFFSHDQIVVSKNPSSKSSKSSRVGDLPDAATLLQLLLFMMRNIDDLVRDVENKNITNLRTKILQSDYFEDMPDGKLFDNVFYLLQNIDVASIQQSPMNHFLKWGQSENRKWRVKTEG
jgi:hypothetical protein